MRKGIFYNEKKEKEEKKIKKMLPGRGAVVSHVPRLAELAARLYDSAAMKGDVAHEASHGLGGHNRGGRRGRGAVRTGVAA